MSSALDSTAHKVVDMLVHNSDAATVPNLLLSYIRTTLFPSPASSHPSPPLPSLYSILTLPAPINYCEPDYSISPYVAEFFNTATNLSFILAAVYAFAQCRRFHLPFRFTLLATAVLLTGLFSAVYHATLTWAGLKLDELSENLVFITLIHMHRPLVVTAVHAVVAAVGVLFVHVLLFCELHIVGVSVVTIYHYASVMKEVPEIKGPFLRGLALSIVGEACWVVDHLACESVSRQWQLHGWWHVLMGACIHELFVVAVIVYSPGGQAARRRGKLQASGAGGVEGDGQGRGEEDDGRLQSIVLQQRCGLDWLHAESSKGKQL